MNRLPSAGFVLLLAVGLQGCCFRTGEVDRDPGADEAAAATRGDTAWSSNDVVFTVE